MSHCRLGVNQFVTESTFTSYVLTSTPKLITPAGLSAGANAPPELLLPETDEAEEAEPKACAAGRFIPAVTAAAAVAGAAATGAPDASTARADSPCDGAFAPAVPLVTFSALRMTARVSQAQR